MRCEWNKPWFLLFAFVTDPFMWRDNNAPQGIPPLVAVVELLNLTDAFDLLCALPVRRLVS